MKTANRTKSAVLGTTAAAEYLATSTGQLGNWRSRGEGPRFARIGRRVVYRVSDLDAFIDQHIEGGAA